MHSTARLKLTDLNPHLMCVLCGGYLVDATTIIECLHSFCRTCITCYLESSKQCPICDVQVHKTKPVLNLRRDKTLQDLVYKLVPGLFQDEMVRRRAFYAAHPNAAAKLSSPSAGEERGDVSGDRFVCVEEDKISLILHHCNRLPRFGADGVLHILPHEGATQGQNQTCENRYLLCPAALTVAHLKKFVRHKFDLRPDYKVELFHSDETLKDSYTLTDVAYIYGWRRVEPLRLHFFVYDGSQLCLRLIKPSVDAPIVAGESSLGGKALVPGGKRSRKRKSQSTAEFPDDDETPTTSTARRRSSVTEDAGLAPDADAGHVGETASRSRVDNGRTLPTEGDDDCPISPEGGAGVSRVSCDGSPPRLTPSDLCASELSSAGADTKTPVDGSSASAGRQGADLRTISATKMCPAKEGSESNSGSPDASHDMDIALDEGLAKVKAAQAVAVTSPDLADQSRTAQDRRSLDSGKDSSMDLSEAGSLLDTTADKSTSDKNDTTSGGMAAPSGGVSSRRPLGDVIDDATSDSSSDSDSSDSRGDDSDDTDGCCSECGPDSGMGSDAEDHVTPPPPSTPLASIPCDGTRLDGGETRGVWGREDRAKTNLKAKAKEPETLTKTGVSSGGLQSPPVAAPPSNSSRGTEVSGKQQNVAGGSTAVGEATGGQGDPRVAGRRPPKAGDKRESVAPRDGVKLVLKISKSSSVDGAPAQFSVQSNSAVDDLASPGFPLPAPPRDKPPHRADQGVKGAAKTHGDTRTAKKSHQKTVKKAQEAARSAGGATALPAAAAATGTSAAGAAAAGSVHTMPPVCVRESGPVLVAPKRPPCPAARPPPQEERDSGDCGPGVVRPLGAELTGRQDSGDDCMTGAPVAKDANVVVRGLSAGSPPPPPPPPPLLQVAKVTETPRVPPMKDVMESQSMAARGVEPAFVQAPPAYETLVYAGTASPGEGGGDSDGEQALEYPLPRALVSGSLGLSSPGKSPDFILEPLPPTTITVPTPAPHRTGPHRLDTPSSGELGGVAPQVRAPRVHSSLSPRKDTRILKATPSASSGADAHGSGIANGGRARDLTVSTGHMDAKSRRNSHVPLAHAQAVTSLQRSRGDRALPKPSACPRMTSSSTHRRHRPRALPSPLPPKPTNEVVLPFAHGHVAVNPLPSPPASATTPHVFVHPSPGQESPPIKRLKSMCTGLGGELPALYAPPPPPHCLYPPVFTPPPPPHPGMFVGPPHHHIHPYMAHPHQLFQSHLPPGAIQYTPLSPASLSPSSPPANGYDAPLELTMKKGRVRP